MIPRPIWHRRIQAAWERRSVVWLMGVRRVGKTCLCQGLAEIEYFDCELPRLRRQLDDPEAFLDRLRGRRVVLDEIHRLANPAEVLKIAADHYPTTQVLATGSSTLGASARFRDTLAGRKAEIWLTPMNSADLEAFGRTELDHRFLRGGLPPFFLAVDPSEVEYQEWMDAYWAKDIQELFRLERRYSFQRFAELLFAQSGGLFEATKFARPCEVSRTTITNYLAVLEATFVVHVVRPFGKDRASEIVAAPRVYGFDTGFVCYHKGWERLRREDMGLLWEHYVLNELHGRISPRSIFYWRDKRRKEVDLILRFRGRPPVAIECKWSADHFRPGNMNAFRNRYPEGESFVVAADVGDSYDRTYGELRVRFVGLAGLLDELGLVEESLGRSEPGSHDLDLL